MLTVNRVLGRKINRKITKFQINPETPTQKAQNFDLLNTIPSQKNDKSQEFYDPSNHVDQNPSSKNSRKTVSNFNIYSQAAKEKSNNIQKELLDQIASNDSIDTIRDVRTKKYADYEVPDGIQDQEFDPELTSLLDNLDKKIDNLSDEEIEILDRPESDEFRELMTKLTSEAAQFFEENFKDEEEKGEEGLEAEEKNLITFDENDKNWVKLKEELSNETLQLIKDSKVSRFSPPAPPEEEDKIPLGNFLSLQTNRVKDSVFNKEETGINPFQKPKQETNWAIQKNDPNYDPWKDQNNMSHLVDINEIFQLNENLPDIDRRDNQFSDAEIAHYKSRHVYYAAKRRLFRGTDAYKAIAGKVALDLYSWRVKRATGHFLAPFDESLVNRKMQLGGPGGAEIPLQKWALAPNYQHLMDDLKYGNQDVVRYDTRSGSVNPINMRFDQWAYINHKLHEKFKETPIELRNKRTCQLNYNRRLDLTVLPVDKNRISPVTQMQVGKHQISECFIDSDTDKWPDNRTGYGFIFRKSKANKLIAKTMTNRLQNCHIFLVKPNLGLIPNVILNQDPASLTLIEPLHQFNNHLQTVVSNYILGYTDVGKKFHIFNQSKTGPNNMYGDQFKYQQYQEEIPLRDSPCPIYLFEESPKYAFRNNFTDEPENQELIEQRYPGLLKEWNDPVTPMAQIIFTNPGGISARPVWTHLTEDLSNREGIFRYGRIPISLVTTNVYASRILSKKFNGKQAMLNMGRLAYIVHNYYDIEDVNHIDRNTYLKMHDMMTDPYMLCLVPKIEPDSGPISLVLYEAIMNQFYLHKEWSIRAILRSKILRSEVGNNNFRPDYYAKLICSHANIQNSNAQGKTILPEDFSKIVKAICDEKIVPRKNLDFKQILKIRPNKYVAKSKNFQEKRKIAKIMERLQYPAHISEMMKRYYRETLDSYERERSLLPVDFDQSYEEAVRGLGSLPKVADKFE